MRVNETTFIQVFSLICSVFGEVFFFHSASIVLSSSLVHGKRLKSINLIRKSSVGKTLYLYR